MKQPTRVLTLLLTLVFLLSGCGKEHAAKKEVEQLEELRKQSLKDLRNAEISYDSLVARVSRSREVIRSERNQREFDRVAENGGAGTAEQLRRIKREMDNPGFAQQQQQAAQDAERSLEYANRALEDSRVTLSRRQADLQRTEKALEAAKQRLDAIRVGE